jgi:parvulin-like peptidyl-prolyl isomerase
MIKPLTFTILTLILVSISRVQAESGDGTNALETTVNANDSIVARGKGFEISRREMDQVLSTARAQGELPEDAEVPVVEQLIEIQLVLQKATAAEKAEGQKVADKKFTEILNTLTPKSFEHRLQVTHTTAPELHRMFYEEETSQISLMRQLGIIKATDADAKKLFDSYPPGSYDHPASARIRELLLLTGAGFNTEPVSAATAQAKHQQILELYKRIQAGEDFTALAKQYNEDPVSQNTGGIYSINREQVEFGDLAFSMKTNQISGVLTNEDGYRIFQLLEIIPVQKVAFADIADTLKNAITGDQVRSLAPAYIRQLWKEADVEILDPKLKVAVAANEAEAVAAARAQAAADATNTPPANP